MDFVFYIFQDREESQTETGSLNRNSMLLRKIRKRLLYDTPETSSSETDQIV